MTNQVEITPELQAIIDKEVAGLKSKRDELLEQNKKFKSLISELEEGKTKAEMEAAEKAGNIESVKKQLEDRYAKTIKEKEEALNGLSAKLQKVVIDDGLSSALVKAGVAPQYMEAARALLKSSNQFSIGDDLTPKINDETLSDYVLKWATSEAGKPFIQAPINAGAGAKGSNGVSRANADKTMKRADFDTLSNAAKAAFMQSGGALTD